MITDDRLEELADALFKGKAINGDAWRLDDNDWVKQRAERWRVLKKELLHPYNEINKTKIKTLERYFLKGKIPRFNITADISISLGFMCWLHPVLGDN